MTEELSVLIETLDFAGPGWKRKMQSRSDG